MSRVGNAPIEIPSGVDVTVKGQSVTVKGPKGELTRVLDEPITAKVEDGTLFVERPNDQRQNKALHGLFRSLVNNMVIGVDKGFSKELAILGVGYRAALKGSFIELQVGFSHVVNLETPEGILVEVPEPTKIIISGIDKELVGQHAANIRAVKKPEPYKGKGIRYVDEYVRRKAGKAGIR
jgi:large subunit ribosomal protein L6